VALATAITLERVHKFWTEHELLQVIQICRMSCSHRCFSCELDDLRNTVVP